MQVVEAAVRTAGAAAQDAEAAVHAAGQLCMAQNAGACLVRPAPTSSLAGYRWQSWRVQVAELDGTGGRAGRVQVAELEGTGGRAGGYRWQSWRGPACRGGRAGRNRPHSGGSAVAGGGACRDPSPVDPCH